jgi:ABC-2 type transport system ATP-binding protein
VIEVEGLTKRFVDKDVVANVSFFVPEGEVLGFLGPNGAGKTTTMRMITGFLSATAGKVRVAGLDVDRDPLGVRARIGYLPENVALYPEMRVDEYLRYRAAVEGVPRGDVRSRVDEVGERCMVNDVRHQVIGTLSKGYRQRVGLAAALVHHPPVLILDEPTVGLDPRQIVKTRELITELGREHTVILSTHILPEVEQICRRVLIIDNGTIVADGTPEQLRAGLTGTAEVKVELEAPPAEALVGLAALPGAKKVRDVGNGRFQITVGGGADIRREVFSLAVQKGWVLLELSSSLPSLETVFLRLTTQDVEAEHEAPAEEAANA